MARWFPIGTLNRLGLLEGTFGSSGIPNGKKAPISPAFFTGKTRAFFVSTPDGDVQEAVANC